jgi:hypothetical protein
MCFGEHPSSASGTSPDARPARSTAPASCARTPSAGKRTWTGLRHCPAASAARGTVSSGRIYGSIQTDAWEISRAISGRGLAVSNATLSPNTKTGSRASSRFTGSILGDFVSTTPACLRSHSSATPQRKSCSRISSSSKLHDGDMDEYLRVMTRHAQDRRYRISAAANPERKAE